jgi:leucyl/phenylalanyl-tRNA--protein transferase
VIEACAEPAPDRKITWISPEIIGAYCELHKIVFAHSVEIWIDGKLAGGLYGVALGGLFAGESMFSRVRDSSKIALVYLVERLRRGGFCLLDTQFMTEHLRHFGAIEMPRHEYQVRLAQALTVWARF